MVDFDTMSIVAEMGEDPSEEVYRDLSTVEMINLVFEHPQALFITTDSVNGAWISLKDSPYVQLHPHNKWNVKIPALKAAITHSQLRALVEKLQIEGKEINADNIAEALGISSNKKEK